MPAYASPLVHRICGEREDVQGAVERPPCQRARDPLIGLRHERRRVVERDRFAVGNELRRAEDVPEQLQRLLAIGRRGFADQDRRQLEVWAAPTHHLQPRILPVDEPAAAAAAENRGLGAES